jgi:hypothetical protein
MRSDSGTNAGKGNANLSAPKAKKAVAAGGSGIQKRATKKESSNFPLTLASKRAGGFQQAERQQRGVKRAQTKRKEMFSRVAPLNLAFGRYALSSGEVKTGFALRADTLQAACYYLNLKSNRERPPWRKRDVEPG